MVAGESEKDQNSEVHKTGEEFGFSPFSIAWPKFKGTCSKLRSFHRVQTERVLREALSFWIWAGVGAYQENIPCQFWFSFS